jgi:hypothetical protein
MGWPLSKEILDLTGTVYSLLAVVTVLYAQTLPSVVCGSSSGNEWDAGENSSKAK